MNRKKGGQNARKTEKRELKNDILLPINALRVSVQGNKGHARGREETNTDRDNFVSLERREKEEEDYVEERSDRSTTAIRRISTRGEGTHPHENSRG